MTLRSLPLFAFVLALGFSCCSAPDVQDTTLKVMSYNIKHGYGNDGVIDLERAAMVIEAEAPDVVTLQEVDDACNRSGSVDQARWLGERLGMEPLFGTFMDYDGGRYGMALLSRLAVVSWNNHELPPGAEPRSALAARLRLADGSEVVVVGIHFYASRSERLSQARTLHDLYADEQAPVILAGDFNSERGGPVMDLLLDSWQDPDKGVDRFTIPSDDPKREIDFILYRPGSSFEVERMDVIDDPLTSDHRPLVLELKKVNS
jgi:endonuclease/exonuclease/phosphatase family metal-dependent hydrolase